MFDSNPSSLQFSGVHCSSPARNFDVPPSPFRANFRVADQPDGNTETLTPDRLARWNGMLATTGLREYGILTENAELSFACTQRVLQDPMELGAH
jgi:hypothetical protein